MSPSRGIATRVVAGGKQKKFSEITLNDLSLTPISRALVVNFDGPAAEAAAIALIRENKSRRAKRLLVASVNPTTHWHEYACARCGQVITNDPPDRFRKEMSDAAADTWNLHARAELLEVEAIFPALVAELASGQPIPPKPFDRFDATDNDYARRRKKKP